MRELTFKGFLTRYVRQLAQRETNSIYQLAAEAGGSNPRLREPLLLYAVFTQKQDVLLRATKEPVLREAYRQLVTLYTAEEMTHLLEQASPVLPEAYHKVWRSYRSRKNRGQADEHTKELMRQRVKRLQEKNGITNYRIYTDLNLNPGNLNAWLKHGTGDKVSLETARKTLRYVEGQAAQLPVR
ncbi:MAG: transcriptional regulator [Oscillospiraceae bacterium]|nr:transcriptional regulator [Oscillospiraceae bacterium]